MLQNLLRKKTLVAVGLNSGTSADGLDLVAVRISLVPERLSVKLIAGKTVPYPRKLQAQLSDVVNDRILSVDDIIRLDRHLGCFYGDQARLFCSYLKRRKVEPDLVSSHGQTVRHLPGQVKNRNRKESGTLQLGHPESIADRTGLLTVADFRQADIASGGEGAPITSRAMWELFSSTREHRLIINIGGIANYFLFPNSEPADRMLAEDCGPGNSLIDIMTKKYFSKKYDHQGRLASRGTISKRLLTILLADNFLKRRYGPSTGRERFGEKFAGSITQASSRLRLNRFDILASTTELTAIAIANSIRPHVGKYGLAEIFLSGGGCKNEYLVHRLKRNLPEAEFFSVDRLTFDPDYLEAVCYAVMGVMAIHSWPAGLPHITGARRQAVAGRIMQPPKGSA
jgi:anhydro-N-acetylmuramic acid kinase